MFIRTVYILLWLQRTAFLTTMSQDAGDVKYDLLMDYVDLKEFNS